MASIVYTDAVGSGPDWQMAKPNKQLFDYLGEMARQSMQNVTAATQQFMKTAGDVYQAVTYSDAMRKARAVIRDVASTGTLDVISELNDIGRMQQARPLMQRMIMADPVIRELYHDDKINGYSGSYVDNASGVSGAEHYDYRRATDGMWLENEDGVMQARVFYEDTGDDEPFDALQQMDIMRTWDHVRAAIKRGKEDPTSPENDML